MQNISLTLATLHNVTQAATLCPKVDSFSHNTSWIYGNSPPARYVPSPNFDVSAASPTTLKLACLFHTIGRVNDHLYYTRLPHYVCRSLLDFVFTSRRLISRRLPEAGRTRGLRRWG